MLWVLVLHLDIDSTAAAIRLITMLPYARTVQWLCVGGREQWQRLVQEFWQPFDQTVHQADQVDRIAVVEAMDKLLEPHIFPAQEGQSQEEARACPACGTGRLGLKTFASGGFVGCSRYPDCSFSRPLSPSDPAQAGLIDPSGAIALGEHPDGIHTITLRSGRFGAFVQLDKPPSDGPPATEEAPAKGRKRSKSKEDTAKPKRASIPKGTDPMSVTLDMAVQWLVWPKSLGEHPQEGGLVEACTGGFGPYVRHNKVNAALPKGMELEAVTMDDALHLLTKRKERLAKQPVKKGAAKATAEAPNEAPAAGQPKATRGRRKLADTAAAPAGSVKKGSKAKTAGSGISASESSQAETAGKKRSRAGSKAGTTVGGIKTAAKAKAKSPDEATGKAKPANPFLRFCQQQRPLVKAEHPDLKLGQVAKILGEQWRALSAAEQQSFRNPV